jgi:hypothetical protein
MIFTSLENPSSLKDFRSLNLCPIGGKFTSVLFEAKCLAGHTYFFWDFLIVADNGSDWFISGAPDERWNNDILNKEFRKVKGEDFEAVDSSKLQLEKDSGATKLNIPQH